jgi:hypothetical protein
MSRRWQLIPVLSAVALAAGACGSSGGTSDKELEGLVVAEKPAPASIDLTKASRDAQTLAAVTALPWSRAATQLGDHRLVITTKSEVREGNAVLETLEDTTTIDLARDGSYRALYENKDDYGREVVFLGGKLYLRPRYARWHERAPETDNEPVEIRDQMASALGAHLAIYAHGLEVSDKGSVQEAGRAGHRLELKLAPSPKAAPKPTLTQHAWREGLTVEAAAGEVVLDDATGLPLKARLDATVAFVRDGKRLTMTLALSQSVAPGAVAVAKPEDDQIVATPVRLREVDDRNLLLQGIAPPAGKGGGVPAPKDQQQPPTPSPQPASVPDKAPSPPDKAP